MAIRDTSKRQKLQQRFTSTSAKAEPGLIRLSEGNGQARTDIPLELDQYLLTFVLDVENPLVTFKNLQLVSRSSWLLAEDWLAGEQGRRALSQLAARQPYASSSKLKSFTADFVELGMGLDMDRKTVGRARQTRKSMKFQWPQFQAPFELSSWRLETGVKSARAQLASARGANFHGIALQTMVEHGFPEELMYKPLNLWLYSHNLDHAGITELLTLGAGRALDLRLTIKNNAWSLDISAAETKKLVKQLTTAIENQWQSGTLRIDGASVSKEALSQCLVAENWRFEQRGSTLIARHRNQDKSVQITLCGKRNYALPMDLLHIEGTALYVSKDDWFAVRPGGVFRIDNIVRSQWACLRDALQSFMPKPSKLSLLELHFKEAQGSQTEDLDTLLKFPQHADRLKLTGLRLDRSLLRTFIQKTRSNSLKELALINCALEELEPTILAKTLRNHPFSLAHLELGVDRASPDWLMEVLPPLASNPELGALTIQADGDPGQSGLYAVIDAVLKSKGSGTLSLTWRCGVHAIQIDIPRNRPRQLQAILDRVVKLLARS